MPRKPLVVKIGGHLLFRKEELDANYIKELVSVLRENEDILTPLIVVVGGGAFARKYIGALRRIGIENESACDYIGIEVSRVNAALIAAAYYGVPHEIPRNFADALQSAQSSKITFMGGLQPGQSTTTVAALIAEALGAHALIIATDVDGVYTADPKKDPKAKLLRTVTTTELRVMFHRITKAGGYALLDPYTLDIIERGKLTTKIINGKPATNIVKAAEGESIGTTIKPI